MEITKFRISRPETETEDDLDLHKSQFTTRDGRGEEARTSFFYELPFSLCSHSKGVSSFVLFKFLQKTRCTCQPNMTAETASAELSRDATVEERDVRDIDSIMEGKQSKPVKQVIPLETEAMRMKQKCKDLKQKITEIEKQNQVRAIGVSRAKDSISRLRFEYSSLLELIEYKATQLPLPELKKIKPESISAESIESLTMEDIAQLLSKSPADLSNIKKILPNALGDLIAERQQQYINSASHGDSSSSSRNRRKRPLPTPSAASVRKKMRDPREPKRPTNAYLFFCDAERDRVKAEWAEAHPNEHIDLSKAMTEAWKKMSDENKRPYFEMYEKDKERYQKAIKEYAHIKEQELLEGSTPIPEKATLSVADAKPILKADSASASGSVEPETPASAAFDMDTPEGDISQLDDNMDETLEEAVDNVKKTVIEDEDAVADADIDENEDEGEDIDVDEEDEDEGRDDSVASINPLALPSEDGPTDLNSDLPEEEEEEVEEEDEGNPQTDLTDADNGDYEDEEANQSTTMKSDLDSFHDGSDA